MTGMGEIAFEFMSEASSENFFPGPSPATTSLAIVTTLGKLSPPQTLILLFNQLWPLPWKWEPHLGNGELVRRMKMHAWIFFLKTARWKPSMPWLYLILPVKKWDRGWQWLARVWKVVTEKFLRQTQFSVLSLEVRMQVSRLEGHIVGLTCANGFGFRTPQVFGPIPLLGALIANRPFWGLYWRQN